MRLTKDLPSKRKVRLQTCVLELLLESTWYTNRQGHFNIVSQYNCCDQGLMSQRSIGCVSLLAENGLIMLRQYRNVRLQQRREAQVSCFGWSGHRCSKRTGKNGNGDHCKQLQFLGEWCKTQVAELQSSAHKQNHQSSEQATDYCGKCTVCPKWAFRLPQ